MPPVVASRPVPPFHTAWFDGTHFVVDGEPQWETSETSVEAASRHLWRFMKEGRRPPTSEDRIADKILEKLDRGYWASRARDPQSGLSKVLARAASAPVPEPAKPVPQQRYFDGLRESNPRGQGETQAAWARRLHGLMQADRKDGRIEKLWAKSTIYRELSGRK
jgi:hypothetical protein